MQLPMRKIQELLGREILVELKGEKGILRGKLESYDEYLNLHLSSTIEIVEGERNRALGTIVLRGNNIIWIAPAE